MTYEKIKQNYEKGYWSAAMVQMAAKKGAITQAQCDQITSGSAIDPQQALIDEIVQEVKQDE